MTNEIWLWGGFVLFIILMLALDLGVFHKENHEIKLKEALMWTMFWVSLALIFNIGIYHFMGSEKALQFLTGYLIEESLSIDNVFVFMLIFSYFKVPPKYQHKILFWGILGAMLMRITFILSGILLIEKFHWIIFVFGGFLVITGIRLAFQDEISIKPDSNPVIRLFKRYFRITDTYHKDKFFIRENGVLVATPMMIVLIFIEVSDLIFAVDSIPAILAITSDPFIVFTSNVFAILGLRSLFFAISAISKYFIYLKYGLAAILTYVGTKMLVSDYYKIDPLYSLLVILAILSLSIFASMLAVNKKL
ncbi:MAG: TerC family protein [Saprospiraceae bacterium]|nr:TerC family protein [Saprospiraceae bacterium]MBK7736185.1 TerC family protein [Saprospiraceae bacterium]MBK7912449.1 TerC family protein [Saprospiraceae bacterium]